MATGANEMLWKMETEFEFKNMIMKIVGPLMKKSFIQRTEKDMERFKKLVETQ